MTEKPSARKKSKEKVITIHGARENNLKNISLTIPRNKIIVFTGVSGSGKSSLVFDTIYAEGQRRYVESLSSYTRQFLERIDKPDVDFITGISPAVAIQQKNSNRNIRSTVGTVTEVYDYLRILFARVGKTYCFSCGKVVEKASTGTIADWLETQPDESKWYLAFPLFDHKGRNVKEEMEVLKKKGFFRIVVKGKLIDLNEADVTKGDKKKIRVVVQRFKIKQGAVREQISDSVEAGFKEGENTVILIDAETGAEQEFNKRYECCGIRYEEPEPRFFSSNTSLGACPVCQGNSIVSGVDMERVVPNEDISILDGAIAPWRPVRFSKYLRALIKASKEDSVPVSVPFRNLTEEQIDKIRKGTKNFVGLDRFFELLESDRYKMHIAIFLSKYRGHTACSACKGSRLRREALQVKISDHSIWDIVRKPIEKALEFFEALTLSDYEFEIAKRIIEELKKRLSFLQQIGLGYLTLDRQSATLSGGEMQRINLATALGSALTGTLYVLDEPSIGLHPADNERLIGILKNLRDLGNTVLVVEHDPEIMRQADYIVDMGPAAGKLGGEIVFAGTYEEIVKSKNSLTGKYLSHEKQIPVPESRSVLQGDVLSIREAREHNLRNISVDIPLKKLVVVTGVSGSGKSTLVHDVLYAAAAKSFGISGVKPGRVREITGIQKINGIEIVDQSPIGKSPRSNPISYIGAFEHIREIFALTHQAKVRGYKAGHFSFNIPGGRCEMCQGAGFIKVEMQFLADVYLDCEECGGSRYKKETREITYRGKNIVDVLTMTVDEALEFFTGHNKIVNALQVLSDVGMGYIALGQPANTLSGGEAQRIKLATHLSAGASHKNTLFIFDEPTTGLHFDDIAKLLKCLTLLVEHGNSVLIIEHNLEVIKCADHIIDLGPGAGEKGGYIVAEGTPEQIVQNEASVTGRYLRPLLRAGNE